MGALRDETLMIVFLGIFWGILYGFFVSPFGFQLLIRWSDLREIIRILFPVEGLDGLPLEAGGLLFSRLWGLAHDFGWASIQGMILAFFMCVSACLLLMYFDLEAVVNYMVFGVFEGFCIGFFFHGNVFYAFMMFGFFSSGCFGVVRLSKKSNRISLFQWQGTLRWSSGLWALIKNASMFGFCLAVMFVFIIFPQLQNLTEILNDEEIQAIRNHATFFDPETYEPFSVVSIFILLWGIEIIVLTLFSFALIAPVHVILHYFKVSLAVAYAGFTSAVITLLVVATDFPNNKASAMIALAIIFALSVMGWRFGKAVRKKPHKKGFTGAYIEEDRQQRKRRHTWDIRRK